MATERVQFGLLESGDSQESGASPRVYNCLLDGKGALRRRPGLTSWSGFPSTIPEASEVLGLAAFEGELYYVTDYRRVWKVDSATATALSSGGPTTYLAGTGLPVFAVTRGRLVIAGGEELLKVESAASSAAVLLGSPPDCTQVVALAQRLFVDDNTSTQTIGRIRHSGVGYTLNESWDSLDTVDTEAATDDIVALRSNSNELWAFGERTLQIFSPDPISILAPGRTKNRGCSAAASVVQIDEAFFWLDEQKQFVVSDGRAIETISDPIASVLDDLETVSDCYAFRVNIGQFDCVVATFPTEGRTFCWQRGGGWSEWSTWTHNVGHGEFAAKSAYYWPEEDLHLVGLSTGQVVQLDDSVNTDMGSIIKAEAWTGFIDHGTLGYKDCQRVRVRLRRGQSSTSGRVLLSWRDDLGPWSLPLVIETGSTGDYVIEKVFDTLGVYRSRQWKLEMTDAQGLVVAAVEEEFEVLS